MLSFPAIEGEGPGKCIVYNPWMASKTSTAILDQMGCWRGGGWLSDDCPAGSVGLYKAGNSDSEEGSSHLGGLLHQLVIQDSFGRVSTILLRPQEGRKPEINRHTKHLQKQQSRAEISFTDATGRRHIYPCCVIHLSWNSQLRMARNKV